MHTHIQEQDVPMTCETKRFVFLLPFREHALHSEAPSRLFALCNLLGPPSLNRVVRLFPSIYNCSVPEFFSHQESKPVDF